MWVGFQRLPQKKFNLIVIKIYFFELTSFTSNIKEKLSSAFTSFLTFAKPQLVQYSQFLFNSQQTSVTDMKSIQMIRRNLHVDVNDDDQSAVSRSPADAGDITDSWREFVWKIALLFLLSTRLFGFVKCFQRETRWKEFNLLLFMTRCTDMLPFFLHSLNSSFTLSSAANVLIFRFSFSLCFRWLKSTF